MIHRKSALIEDDPQHARLLQRLASATSQQRPPSGRAALPALDLEQPDAIKNILAEHGTEVTHRTAPPSHATVRGHLGVTIGKYIQTSQGTIWLQGNAVFCACPECQAPMSVRIWLMVADCWCCQNSIQLTEEQRRAVEKLIAQLPRHAAGTADRLATSPRRPLPASSAAEPVAALDDGRLPQVDETLRAVKLLRKGVGALPAWLVSFLVHLALLLILALILLGPGKLIPPAITISTFVSSEDSPGGVRDEAELNRPLDFDSLLPEVLDLDPEQWEQLQQQAERDAEKLLEDPNPSVPLAALSDVRKNIQASSGPIVAARDPRVRREIVSREGGTTLTEAAVSRGLFWLASVQNRDGSWSLENYDRHRSPGNRGDVAATSLALLPFLGAGQTHEYGVYKQTVQRGLKWLVENQKSDGDLRAGFDSDAGMYAHGQAAIVLVEALAMTGDEQLRDPAQKAIQFIEQAQHKDGGWRYRPGQPGDTSVFGWQLMALQSARSSNTGLKIDDATWKLADYYLDAAGRAYRSRRWQLVPDGALYRYLPQQDEPSAAMTAEALLCRMYLGWKRDDPRMMFAVSWLLENHPPGPDELNVYYWYYATQVMHHYGGRQWTQWNRLLRDLLVLLQQQSGPHAGSWDPRPFRWGSSGGRIYVTSFAVCTLEVYYRHLPLFHKIELE